MANGTVETVVEDRYPSRVDGRIRRIARQEPVVWGDVHDGPLTKADLAQFEAEGFVVLEDLLGATEVEDLLLEVERLSHLEELDDDERLVSEPDTGAVRSVFEVHELSPVFGALCEDTRLRDPARQILGSQVAIHQSRVNRKPGFDGREFSWHSDFETWHVEDGMPAMRALTASVALTSNRMDNGSLLIIPGSHRTFVGCAGETPSDHYRESLRAQRYGVPDRGALSDLAAAGGVRTVALRPGSVVLVDCNCMHGSNSNITPFGRCNLFVVYNSIQNPLGSPFGGTPPRPRFLAARDDDTRLR